MHNVRTPWLPGRISTRMFVHLPSPCIAGSTVSAPGRLRPLANRGHALRPQMGWVESGGLAQPNQG